MTKVFHSVALGRSEAKALSILSLQPEPAVEEALTDEPAVVEPAVEEALADEPAVVEAAVVEAAVVEPAVEEPAVVEPAVEETAVTEPRRFTLIKCSKYEWILCRACFRRN